MCHSVCVFFCWSWQNDYPLQYLLTMIEPLQFRMYVSRWDIHHIYDSYINIYDSVCMKMENVLPLCCCWNGDLFGWGLPTPYSSAACSQSMFLAVNRREKVLHYCRSASTNYSAYACCSLSRNQGSKHTILFPQHLWPYLFQTSQLKQLLWKTFPWYHFVFLCCKWWLPACKLWIYIIYIIIIYILYYIIYSSIVRLVRLMSIFGLVFYSSLTLDVTIKWLLKSERIVNYLFITVFQLLSCLSWSSLSHFSWDL